MNYHHYTAELSFQRGEFSPEQVGERGVNITSTWQLYLKTGTKYPSCGCWEPFHLGGLLVSWGASGRALPADQASSHPQ